MSAQQLTQTSDFDLPSEGYIVIVPLSDASKQKISQIQKRYLERFGEENVWLPTGDQLHITFSHIITPDAEYKENKASLFAKLKPTALAALERTATYPMSVTSVFDTVVAYPPAVIITASDDGSLQRLRNVFVDNFDTPEGTRMPPQIIHSTLVRFRHPVDFLAVQELTADIMADFEPFEEHITTLQMIHEKKIFVQEHEILEQFPPVAA